MFTTWKVAGQEPETESPTVTRRPDKSHTRKKEEGDLIGKIRRKANTHQNLVDARVDQSNECSSILPTGALAAPAGAA
ncbi:MAG: hypothetical protein JKY26_09090 [Pseudomonas sp.]|nr:hypothetical protein [Pseudomonas sp.]